MGKGSKRPRITDDQKKTVLSLKEDGVSGTEIAKQVGISVPSVYSILNNAAPATPAATGKRGLPKGLSKSENVVASTSAQPELNPLGSFKAEFETFLVSKIENEFKIQIDSKDTQKAVAIYGKFVEIKKLHDDCVATIMALDVKKR